VTIFSNISSKKKKKKKNTKKKKKKKKKEINIKKNNFNIKDKKKTSTTTNKNSELTFQMTQIHCKIREITIKRFQANKLPEQISSGKFLALLFGLCSKLHTGF
jgi:hypothetical protein